MELVTELKEALLLLADADEVYVRLPPPWLCTATRILPFLSSSIWHANRDVYGPWLLRRWSPWHWQRAAQWATWSRCSTAWELLTWTRFRCCPAISSILWSICLISVAVGHSFLLPALTHAVLDPLLQAIEAVVDLVLETGVMLSTRPACSDLFREVGGIPVSASPFPFINPGPQDRP